MKTTILLFVSTLLFFNLASARTLSEAKTELEELHGISIIEIELVEESLACSVYKFKDDELNTWWGILAQVATSLLPVKETWNYACSRLTGNPDACNVVYEVVDGLVTLRSLGKYMVKTGKYLSQKKKYWKWEAGHHSVTSKAKAVVDTYNAAQDVKHVFEAFTKIRDYCTNIPWKPVTTKKEEITSSSGNTNSIAYRTEYVVTTSKAYFYSKPNSSYKKGTYCVIGDKVEILGVQGTWYKVEYVPSNTIGWIKINELTKKKYVKVNCSKAYFYSSPSNSYKKKAYVINGDNVQILSKNSNWTKVIYYGRSKNTTGWIRNSCLNF